MNLILFFTLGLSLKKWDKVGMLQREIAPYNIMAGKFNKIYLFTYGSEKDDKLYKKYLKDNIVIIYNRYNINKYLYSILMPFLNFKYILHRNNITTTTTILKSNQLIGAWTAYIANIMDPYNTKFILRTGYTASLLEKGVNGKTLKYRLFILLEYILYKSCDKAIVTSYESLTYAIDKYNIDSNKVKKIVNYIDTDVFKPMDETKNGRILFIGRIAEVKNLKYLIESLIGTKMGLDIIGDGNSDLKSEAIALIKRLGVDVRFIGSVANDKLPKIINRYSLFILPSIREGMPKTLLEAMACGIPCIGSDVPGINEVITDGYNGLLFDIDNKESQSIKSQSIKKSQSLKKSQSIKKSQSLNSTINKLIYDKKLYKKLGINARTTIVKYYSLKKLIKRELDIYEKLCN